MPDLMPALVEKPKIVDFLRREVRRLQDLNRDQMLECRSALFVARQAEQLTRLMAADLARQRAENTRLRRELTLYGYEADF